MSLHSLSPYQKRRYSRLTCEQIGEIHNLAKRGASLKQIAMQLGVAKTTVYYYAKRYCRKMTRFNI
ncbi:helix-turn-helix domain-containing protein [Candidatus Bathyarchaeota archaeon]|nr:helix-turn-helix domain-containing protein [Candidatus Bathyarchaeota archaeon]